MSRRRHMDQKTDMQIVKTTDYFNMTKEEAAEMKNEYDTREEAEVLDAGLEHYFFGTYEGLCKDYESTEFKNYVKKHKYEVLIFEFVAENSNNNKYCIILK